MAAVGWLLSSSEGEMVDEGRSQRMTLRWGATEPHAVSQLATFLAVALFSLRTHTYDDKPSCQSNPIRQFRAGLRHCVLFRHTDWDCAHCESSSFLLLWVRLKWGVSWGRSGGCHYLSTGSRLTGGGILFTAPGGWLAQTRGWETVLCWVFYQSG